MRQVSFWQSLILSAAVLCTLDGCALPDQLTLPDTGNTWNPLFGKNVESRGIRPSPVPEEPDVGFSVISPDSAKRTFGIGVSIRERLTDSIRYYVKFKVWELAQEQCRLMRFRDTVTSTPYFFLSDALNYDVRFYCGHPLGQEDFRPAEPAEPQTVPVRRQTTDGNALYPTSENIQRLTQQEVINLMPAAEANPGPFEYLPGPGELIQAGRFNKALFTLRHWGLTPVSVGKLSAEASSVQNLYAALAGVMPQLNYRKTAIATPSSPALSFGELIRVQAFRHRGFTSFRITYRLNSRTENAFWHVEQIWFVSPAHTYRLTVMEKNPRGSDETVFRLIDNIRFSRGR